jgi:hypothetical protein
LGALFLVYLFIGFSQFVSATPDVYVITRFRIRYNFFPYFRLLSSLFYAVRLLSPPLQSLGGVGCGGGVGGGGRDEVPAVAAPASFLPRR